MYLLPLILLSMFASPSKTSLRIDFGQDADGQRWRVVNDGVMGGLSYGQARLMEDKVLFQGEISLDNNGGFSSLRSPYGRFDLSQYKTVTIRLKTQGQGFALQLYRSRVWYEPYLRHAIQAEEGEWTTVTIPLADFENTRVGRTNGQTARQEWLANTIQLSFINTGKKAGPFILEVDYIEFR